MHAGGQYGLSGSPRWVTLHMCLGQCNLAPSLMMSSGPLLPTQQEHFPPLGQCANASLLCQFYPSLSFVSFRKQSRSGLGTQEVTGGIASPLTHGSQSAKRGPGAARCSEPWAFPSQAHCFTSIMSIEYVVPAGRAKNKNFTRDALDPVMTAHSHSHRPWGSWPERRARARPGCGSCLW